MKGRDGKGAADLLVCFPSRAHLSLMPKSICSPARPSDNSNRHRHPYHPHHPHPHHRRNRSTGPVAHASPLIWTKTSKQLTRGADMDEPTSPKVTCAGQIKVRPTGSSACRNWQSVMEEIERIHNHNANQRKKKTTSLGFKKDILHFLTCLRTIRFDFRCFGSFPHQDIIDSDEEEEEGDEDETQVVEGGEGSESEASTTVFSKWFMVLQENKVRNCEDRTLEEEPAPAVPPPNALLLMRCRSAPAQTRLQQTQQEEEEEEAKVDEKAAQQVADEDHHHHHQKKKRESLAMVMKYDTDFNKLSPDIAKETWVVMDPFSRSTSWKRW